MKRLTFSMTPDVYRKFSRLAESAGMTMADVLREMVESFCDDAGVKK